MKFLIKYKIYAGIKIIIQTINSSSYLHNWFKSTILPEEWNHYEIKTIRSKFYNLAAIICGTGSYRHIRYSLDKALENLINAVID